MADSPSPAQPQANTTPPVRAKRRRRWLIAITLIVGVAVGLILIVTRSPLTRAIVIPRLARALRVDLDADGVAINLDGTIVVRGLRATAPNIDGPAAEFLSARRCVIDLDWSTIRRDRPTVRSVRFDEPVARLSVESRTGALNVETLALLSDPSAKEPIDIPSVELRNATVELGEHAGATYTPLKSVTLNGTLAREGDRGYLVALRETEQSAAAGAPVSITGLIRPGSADFTADRIDLRDWPPAAVPTPAREVYRQLDLAGQVGSMRAQFSSESGVAVSLSLQNVAVSLPFDASGNYAPRGPFARMTDVTGDLRFARDTVTADLTGFLEDLPYHVDLEYRGIAADSPFVCSLRTENYVLSQTPGLLPFLPEIISERLNDFSNPTGVIDAEVVLARHAPSAPVDIERGTISFRGGIASHLAFPYPLQNATGVVTFDARRATIESISATCPNGASVAITGWIEPLTEDAHSHIEIHARHAPVDDQLRTALKQRAPILEEIFSRRRHEQLVARGLLPSTTAQGETFELGGLADVDIVLDIPASDTNWWPEIDVSIDRAGILIDRLPLPCIATDTRVHIGGDGARLISGECTTLSGAPIDLEVTVTFTADDAMPIVRANAKDVPIDDHVIFAVTQAGRPEEPRERVETMLRDLALRGVGTCEVTTGPREDGVFGFDADVTLDAPQCDLVSIDPQRPAVRLEGVSSVIHADEREIRIEASARLGPPGSPHAPFRLDATIGLDHPNTPVDVTAQAFGLDAASTVEDLVFVFSPDAARTLADVRAIHAPSGAADALVHVWRAPADADFSTTVQLSAMQSLSFDTEAGAVELTSRQGSITYTAPGLLSIDDLLADTTFRGFNAGSLTASGAMALEESQNDPRHRMDLSVLGLPLDSPAFEWLLEQGPGHEVVALAHDISLAGATDLDLTLTRPTWGAITATARAAPKRIAFARAGHAVLLDPVSGILEFSPDRVDLRDIRAQTDSWSIIARGALARQGDAWRLGGQVNAEGAGTIEPLLGLLPAGVADALGAIELRTPGEARVYLASLDARISPDGSVSDATAQARIELEGAQANIGVAFQDLDATIGLEYAQSPTPGTSPLTLDVAAPALRVGGVLMSGGSTRVEIDPRTRRVVANDIVADCYSGRIAGRAGLEHSAQGDAYSVDLHAAGVRFASTLRDLTWISEDLRDRPREPIEGDPSRGSLSAELTLTGRLGDTPSRRGRGSFQVLGGEIIDLPLLVPIIHMANLQLPASAPVDLAMATWFIRDSAVTFDALSVFAGGVELYGFGSMTLPQRALDLRFTSRVVKPWPVVGQIAEALQNELISTRVRGTLDKPEMSTDSLRTTRAAIARLLGRSDSEHERHMQDIERRAREIRQRVQRAGDRVRRMADSSAMPGDDGP
ncbi:MAG: hypothetical protein H6811_08255 [Phycisphaeraceae bacterium]|nr:hypothetical protein [Phycisphaeraceae bacterium]